MLQVKVFSSNNTAELESQVNEFLSEFNNTSRVIDVKYSVAAVAIEDGRGISDPLALFSAMVYYNTRNTHGV